MATLLFLVAFFRAAPPVTRPIVLALWASAAVGSAAMAAGLVSGRTVLTPLLVLQIFAASSGVLGGYPVINVKVELVYGSYHDVDSSQIAFEQAGALAFREACHKAGLGLLEPIM